MNMNIDMDAYRAQLRRRLNLFFAGAGARCC